MIRIDSLIGVGWESARFVPRGERMDKDEGWGCEKDAAWDSSRVDRRRRRNGHGVWESDLRSLEGFGQSRRQPARRGATGREG